jgi:ABC-2 type transport system ATP-binding protein
MIEVRNLTKRYGSTVAVNNVSFDAEAGEVLGFLGPNGAGKTTTMRVLTCFLPADDGTASIDGYDIFENSIEVRQRIGYLPESAPLYGDMGVIDYLKFIAEIRNIPKSERNDRIKSVVEICGLGPMIQKDVSELSKGYRQRLGLAQSLVHDPPILILDEPTSGLDPSQIIEIRNLIKEIGKEKTIIFSTHILSEVSATCSRVLIISDGRIVANGTPDELAEQAKGEGVVDISIRAPQAEIESKLGDLDFVTGFKQVGTDDGVFRYKISSQQDNIAEELFRFVVENRWSLTELRQESVSLEDVFLTLTGSESADNSN